MTLFDKYGGFATVSKVVMSFYDRVLDSDQIGEYFEDIDMKRLIDFLLPSEEGSATRRFFLAAAIWVRLPFMTDGVPGAGLFAVNASGRARWCGTGRGGCSV